MNSEQVIGLAIKRHDLDASYFQDMYGSSLDTHDDPFLYGRAMVLDELERLLAKLPPGADVLDIGCGTGHLTNVLKSKGFNVRGVEPSQEMRALAHKNFPNIEIKDGISSRLPYPDNSFDLVIAIEVLRYLTTDVNVESYHEIKRVLKPGGWLFVTHINKYATDAYYFFYYIKGLMYALRKKTYHYCRFITPGKEEKLLTNLGFSNATAIGRMAASTRIPFKLSRPLFRAYTKLADRLWGNQRYTSNPSRATAGHLVVMAQK